MEVIDRHKKRKSFIKNSLGVADAYKYYTKTRPSTPEFYIDDKTYRKFIRRVNYLLGEAIMNEGRVMLPANMGSISLLRNENKPVIEDGKVIYKAPVNWIRTIKLWESDPEAKDNKILVKFEPGDVYFFKYHKPHFKFSNISSLNFRPLRKLKLRLRDKIRNKEIKRYYKYGE